MADPSGPGDREPQEHRAEQPTERYARALGDVADAVNDRPRPPGPFSSRSYRRLFTAQFVSSLGDWVGFLAIALLAKTAGGSNEDAAIGFVISARLIPGFFFGSVLTTFLDRWDRKKVMVACDIGRGVVTASLPFIHSVVGLFGVSLLLELMSLMWTPAKEASVPNMVTNEQLAGANSASLAAAYGTIVPAALVFTGLTAVNDVIGGQQQLIAIMFDVLTFFASAALISTLRLPGRSSVHLQAPATLKSMVADAREGWRFIGTTPRVRSVMIGFCTGLIGGGMVLPLGASFSDKVLHAGNTGFGFLEFSLGAGVAVGVVVLSLTKRRMSLDVLFTRAVLGAGVCLGVGASMSRLGWTMLCIAGLGVCAGAVYILGFTILQASAHDEIRGRIFGVFYVLIRFCLLLAFALAPFLSAALDGLSGHLTRTVGGLAIHHEVGFGSFVLPLPGTRLTLWLGGAIIIGAGLLARQGMRAGEPVSTSVRETSWFERVDSDASGREDSHMDTRQLDGPALPGAPG